MHNLAHWYVEALAVADNERARLDLETLETLRIRRTLDRIPLRLKDLTETEAHANHKTVSQSLA